MNFGTVNGPTLDKSSAQDAMRRRYLTPISMVLIQHQIQEILALVERCYPRADLCELFIVQFSFANFFELLNYFSSV